MDTSKEEKINYEEILKNYNWILKKDQPVIISPDSDGFLCGLLMSQYLNWKVVGFYDTKILALKSGYKVKDCVFLDVEIFRKDIKSIGQHLLTYDKKKKAANWDNFSNCLQPNLLRDFDLKSDFTRKYPLATIHFILSILGYAKIVKQLPKSASAPLLFADGVFNNLFGYPENCLDWFNYLDIPNEQNILYPILCQKTGFYEVMLYMKEFFKLRDTFNAKGEYINGAWHDRKTSRTGHQLRISNGKGDIINLVQNGDLFNFHINESSRVIGFLKALAKEMGWEYNDAAWTWTELEVYKFTKGKLESEKGSNQTFSKTNYDKTLTENPISWAIGAQNRMEYTIETPDKLP